MTVMTDPVDSQSRLPTKANEGKLYKTFLETQNQPNFEFRDKRVPEDHADWFALQNKHFEGHGVWCKVLVPRMGSTANGLAAG